ncbi:DUF1616 domain-containing protein [Dictyobacter kobayashii]|uniref:DUF1616 domain-containing protein n=1 Tax=Dictyobacter kobayashii TaxID=2014872 RepID=A0A402AWI2_9CHLR|nr:DUF1616 domain-containing protein [Dictyobacter kobayashii]GCE23439.1 hypothetical protein KDK_72390 [Dictyobacter kobayashii]
MRLKNLDVLLLLVVVVANVFDVWLVTPLPAIGGVLALPLVFICPGYVLAELMFKQQQLDLPQRLLLSIGGSLALDIMGGLLLNSLPGGLKAHSWILWLCLVSLLGSGLLMHIRRDQSASEYPELHPGGILAYLFCAGLALLAIVMIMRYNIHTMAGLHVSP